MCGLIKVGANQGGGFVPPFFVPLLNDPSSIRTASIQILFGSAVDIYVSILVDPYANHVWAAANRTVFDIFLIRSLRQVDRYDDRFTTVFAGVLGFAFRVHDIYRSVPSTSSN